MEPVLQFRIAVVSADWVIVTSRLISPFGTWMGCYEFKKHGRIGLRSDLCPSPFIEALKTNVMLAAILVLPAFQWERGKS